LGRYCKPTEALIIFETEEGYQRALRMNYTRICCFSFTDYYIEDIGFSTETMQEPSNLIWDNAYKSKKVVCTVLKILFL
jgi:hypothetical protein